MLEKKHYPQPRAITGHRPIMALASTDLGCIATHFIASVTNFELAAIMDRQLASLSSLTKWCNGATRHWKY